MKIIQKILVTLIIIGLFGCTKKLSIADFADDFSSYKSELRIEAVLNASNFMDSIVRIDKTILVTDTTLINENDDYTDYLQFIHDSTASSIIIIESITGKLVAKFEWKAQAGIIEDYYRGFEDDSTPIEYFTYGGYRPNEQYSEVKIDYNKQYEFQITTLNGDVIAGSTVPLAPAELLVEDTNWNADTLLLKSDDDIVKLLTDDEVSFGNFTFREVIKSDSTIFVYSSFFPPSEYADLGYSLYSLPRGFFPIGLSQLTVAIFNKEYSQYFISGLPIRDGSLSNLRDQNDNVILGIAGSVAVTKLYVKNML